MDQIAFSQIIPIYQNHYHMKNKLWEKIGFEKKHNSVRKLSQSESDRSSNLQKSCVRLFQNQSSPPLQTNTSYILKVTSHEDKQIFMDVCEMAEFESCQSKSLEDGPKTEQKQNKILSKLNQSILNLKCQLSCLREENNNLKVYLFKNKAQYHQKMLQQISFFGQKCLQIIIEKQNYIQRIDKLQQSYKSYHDSLNQQCKQYQQIISQNSKSLIQFSQIIANMNIQHSKQIKQLQKKYKQEINQLQRSFINMENVKNQVHNLKSLLKKQQTQKIKIQSIYKQQLDNMKQEIQLLNQDINQNIMKNNQQKELYQQKIQNLIGQVAKLCLQIENNRINQEKLQKRITFAKGDHNFNLTTTDESMVFRRPKLISQSPYQQKVRRNSRSPHASSSVSEVDHKQYKTEKSLHPKWLISQMNIQSNKSSKDNFRNSFPTNIQGYQNKHFIQNKNKLRSNEASYKHKVDANYEAHNSRYQKRENQQNIFRTLQNLKKQIRIQIKKAATPAQ